MCYIYQVFVSVLSWISKNSLQVLPDALEQGSANYTLWATGSPPPILLHHIMLTKSCLAVFTLQQQSWAVETETIWPLKTEILTTWPFTEKFTNSRSGIDLSKTIVTGYVRLLSTWNLARLNWDGCTCKIHSKFKIVWKKRLFH